MLENCGQHLAVVIRRKIIGQLRKLPFLHLAILRRISHPLRIWHGYRVMTGSGLIDAEWYTSQNPKTWLARRNPCLHYLWFGARALRSPNRWFETGWYLAQNPDVRRAGVNPLLHYIRHGSHEGRNPHPGFDAAWYQKAYPDIQRAGMHPFVHWVTHGEREGRLPSPSATRTLKPADIAPAGGKAMRESPARSVPDIIDVVVPIYGNLAAARRCLTSLLASQAKTRLRILAVDDCFPDPELARYLDALAKLGKIVLLRNEKNCGFTASVNRGMRETSGDVLLLNSDTEVPFGLADRLVAHAYADANIATVTPFSNNATVCGWPVMGSGCGLPAQFSLAEIDDACAGANAARRYDLPTGVGSCMLIRRAALHSLGFFNEKVFPRGYGEECDFCQRAIKNGWRNVLAADAFVYHEGEQSFGLESHALKQLADRRLADLHPNYWRDVSAFGASDPPHKARFAAIAALLRAARKPVVLEVVHALGGGIRKFVDELVSEDNAYRLVLRPEAHGAHHLAGLNIRLGTETASAAIDLSDPAEAAEVLRLLGVTRIEIQHVLGFENRLHKLITALGVPFDFVVHDYFAICPRINLFHPDTNTYCGEPDHAGCCACLARPQPRALEQDIVLWREQHAWLVREAAEVLCPSHDVAKRLSRYYPGRDFRVVPHEDQEDILRSSRNVRRSTDRVSFRVAVLGTMSPHKGSNLLIRLARAAELAHPRLLFILIGHFEKVACNEPPANIEIVGPYQDEDLEEKIAIADPDAIWFPARWPETYSYTLSAALRSGRPIVAPAIGAFGERLHGLDHARLYPLDAEPEEIFGLLFEVGKAEAASVGRLATGYSPPPTGVPAPRAASGGRGEG
jgi:GT2 family glycosyltransferase/glycosyltransferase involved in cell wall biosynthesis